MNKVLRTQSLSTDLATLLLRLIFGGMFIRYGYMKLSEFDQFVTMFPDSIGIGSRLSLILVIFAEFFCGIFVTVGFLTRLSIIPILITMGVAFFIAHANDAFDVKSIAFVYMLLCSVIFILGSGSYSVDRLLFKK